MDVGADEFEQNLPLLQELVLGADFVGKAPGLRALSQEETPVPASLRWVWHGWDKGREVRPSQDRARPRDAQRGPSRRTRRAPLGLGSGTFKQHGSPWSRCEQVLLSPQTGVAWLVLALALSFFPS